jgi:hypothetical protein
VAALRSWRDRFGVELVGLGDDSMNLRASRRPATKEEALALAREMNAWCPDLLDQLYTPRTYSTLAAALMANEWWYFWWD